MVKVGRGEWQVVTAGWVKIGDLGWGKNERVIGRGWWVMVIDGGGSVGRCVCVCLRLGG